MLVVALIAYAIEAAERVYARCAFASAAVVMLALFSAMLRCLMRLAFINVVAAEAVTPPSRIALAIVPAIVRLGKGHSDARCKRGAAVHVTRAGIIVKETLVVGNLGPVTQRADCE